MSGSLVCECSSFTLSMHAKTNYFIDLLGAIELATDRQALVHADLDKYP